MEKPTIVLPYNGKQVTFEIHDRQFLSHPELGSCTKLSLFRAKSGGLEFECFEYRAEAGTCPLFGDVRLETKWTKVTESKDQDKKMLRKHHVSK